MAPGLPRRLALAGLVAVVTLLHLVVADRVEQSRLELGAAERGPRRLDVSFVRELQPQAPPAQAPRVLPLPRPARAPRQAVAAAAAASAASVASAGAPEPPAPDPEVVVAEAPLPAASTTLPVDAAPAPAAAASAGADTVPAQASAASGAASGDTTFEWPASTRLTYQLTGNYRGPINGRASVEWLRVDAHYQVRLEVSAGPSFAPFFSRRMTSDGSVSEQGLTPTRYDEETKVALRDPRRIELRFEGDTVKLADGRLVPRPAGVQDAASQFVQMTWMFTTHPGLLRRGGIVEIPVALPRNVDVWAYEVLDNESLATPLGLIEAVHVRPRRLLQPGGDLVAESWFAPSLQYLPVRIVIRQDEQTWIDLMIERLPLQAAPQTPAAAASAASARDQPPLKRVP